MKFNTCEINIRTEINQVVLGDNIIQLVCLTKIEREPMFEGCGSPVYCEGFVQISNPAHLKKVPFQFYAGLVKIDLSDFTFKQSEEDVIKAELINLCSHTKIDPGESHRIIAEAIAERKSKGFILWFIGIGISIGWFVTFLCNGGGVK